MPAIKPIHYSKLARVFELDGWVYHHTKGDHEIYTKPDYKRPVVIPKWDPVPVFIIQNNLRTAGMSRERYFELLAQV
ncbi:MAG TPA: type II toxin-antitoxin system HicA family toxin [Blastocatellia bacterium]|nr:type II toxin-antitoxin system HicA family toxin [Blastocatellia bacterium]